MFGPSLDDVATLTLLCLVGQAHATGLFLDRKDQKRVDFLTKSMLNSKYSTDEATYLSWANYFGKGGEESDSMFQ